MKVKSANNLIVCFVLIINLPDQSKSHKSFSKQRRETENDKRKDVCILIHFFASHFVMRFNFFIRIRDGFYRVSEM